MCCDTDTFERFTSQKPSRKQTGWTLINFRQWRCWRSRDTPWSFYGNFPPIITLQMRKKWSPTFVTRVPRDARHWSWWRRKAAGLKWHAHPSTIAIMPFVRSFNPIDQVRKQKSWCENASTKGFWKNQESALFWGCLDLSPQRQAPSSHHRWSRWWWFFVNFANWWWPSVRKIQRRQPACGRFVSACILTLHCYGNVWGLMPCCYWWSPFVDFGSACVIGSSSSIGATISWTLLSPRSVPCVKQSYGLVSIVGCDFVCSCINEEREWKLEVLECTLAFALIADYRCQYAAFAIFHTQMQAHILH